MKATYCFPAVLWMSVALGGCTLAPQYSRPEMPAETVSWEESSLLLSPDERKAAVSVGWREFFANTHLQNLIELALKNNRDLKVSILNIERARALYRVQASSLAPNVDAIGESSHKGVPESVSTTGQSYISRQYTASVGLSYELDFFGRLQSLNEQALEKYLATEEARRNAEIVLISEVASAWIQTIAHRDSLNVSRKTLASQTTSHDMIQRRYEEGIASELELLESQKNVDTAKVKVSEFTSLTETDMTALTLLLGTKATPEMIPEQSLDEIAEWPGLKPGTPSEVLLVRPDILAAEYELKAAYANIGAARANFFPRIVLSSSIGTASSELDQLFDAGTRAWTFMPQIVLPIFTGGRNLANLHVAEKDREIASVRYEKAIQTAFREVSDTLVLAGSYERQLSVQRSLVRAAERSYALSNERYMQGIDSYLAAQTSQRFLFSAQLSYIATRMNREKNMIDLYRALGGGVNE